MTGIAAPAPERRERRRGGLVGPVVLIAAGVALLLNNLGVLGWDVWEALLRLWPVLLIAVGLDLMVGRRSTALSLLIGVAAVAALAAGVWYLGVRPPAPGGTEALSYPLGGAERASVELAYGAGELRAAAMSEPAGLLAGTAALHPGERLERDYAVRGGEAHLRLRATGPSGVMTGSAATPWDLRLSREVPLQLTVSGGAGRTVLDLAQLQVTALDVSAGVGAVELTLPERGRLTANISAGVGETVVRIPAGMEARIHISGGLGDTRVDGRFARSGETYTSAGYSAAAANRVELEISSGVGSVRVESLPEQ